MFRGKKQKTSPFDGFLIFFLSKIVLCFFCFHVCDGNIGIHSQISKMKTSF